MNLVLSDLNQGNKWSVRVEFDFCAKQWKADGHSNFWRRITPSQRGNFEVKSGNVIWLWDRHDTGGTAKRNPVILWDAPVQAGDTARRRGKGLLYDPKEPHLKDLRLRWRVDHVTTLRRLALDLCRRNLPASGLKEPPNCVEGSKRDASPVNADGNRATGCGGFVGWYFKELHAMGVAIPQDRTSVTFQWTPPGGTLRTDTKEIYFSGPTFGHREVARAVEKRRGCPGTIYKEYRYGDGARPQPGDVYVLLRPDGMTRHVGVIIDASGDAWRTADGGGGASGYAVGYTNRKFEAKSGMISGGKEAGKLAGWIDLAALTGDGSLMPA